VKLIANPSIAPNRSAGAMRAYYTDVPDTNAAMRFVREGGRLGHCLKKVGSSGARSTHRR